MIYSNIFRRLAAFSIDTAILLAIYLILSFFLSLNTLVRIIGTLPMIGFWFYGGLFLTAWIYFAGFESSIHSATPGKKILGIRVLDIKGKRISFWRATARYFARAFLRFGIFLIPFTKKKQALHDLIARVVVIRVNSY